MRILKRILTIIIVVFMITITLIDYSNRAVSTITTQGKPVNVAVLLLDFTDDLISTIKQNLEDIQKENQGKVEYTFYDGKSDQSIQNDELDKVLTEGTDLILLNIVNRGNAKVVIDKIKETNTPVILFNREPVTPVPIQSYNRALYIGTDGKEAGILQGKMLVDAWNTSREYIDKNDDKELIEKGYMLGSVFQSPRDYAEALYTCGMNLVALKSPVDGTKYKLDDTLVSIRIPLTDYFYKNMFL